MAKDYRTLKLEILAETKQFLDDLKKSEKQTETFGEKMADFGKKAALAFAAFGAAAVTASVAFAKAAAEDEQSANKLNETLKAVTGATQQQIASVEKYITTTSLATGITDDNLRPAFERLARSTKNVEESQSLLNLSLDLAAATGKPLEATTNALAKAYDGNYTALNRLGLGIDQNLIKTKDFDGIYKQLNTTFGEFSENRSEQAIVKFQRLQVALQEAKEQIGAALLPIFIKLGDFLIKTGIPNLQAFIDGLTGQRGLTVAITDANEGAAKFGERLRGIIDFVVRMKEELAVLGTVIASVFVATKVAAFVTAIQGLIGAFVAWRTAAAGAAVATAAATGGISVGAAAAGVAAAVGVLAAAGIFLSGGGGGGTPANLGSAGTLGPIGGGGGGLTGFTGGGGGAGGGGGGSLAAVSSSVGLTGFKKLKADVKELNRLVGILTGQGVPSTPMTTMGGVQRGEYGVVINVNSPSIIDENGFTRAVVDALNSVERRQAGGASALVGL